MCRRPNYGEKRADKLPRWQMSHERGWEEELRFPFKFRELWRLIRQLDRKVLSHRDMIYDLDAFERLDLTMCCAIVKVAKHIAQKPQGNHIDRTRSLLVEHVDNGCLINNFRLVELMLRRRK